MWDSYRDIPCARGQLSCLKDGYMGLGATSGMRQHGQRIAGGGKWDGDDTGGGCMLRPVILHQSVLTNPG